MVKQGKWFICLTWSKTGKLEDTKAFQRRVTGHSWDCAVFLGVLKSNFRLDDRGEDEMLKCGESTTERWRGCPTRKSSVSFVCHNLKQFVICYREWLQEPE